ncbi:MAG: hypothetical protein ACXWPM_11825 [Bdellovibrionota bacterium]
MSGANAIKAAALIGALAATLLIWKKYGVSSTATQRAQESWIYRASGGLPPK